MCKTNGKCLYEHRVTGQCIFTDEEKENSRIPSDAYCLLQLKYVEMHNDIRLIIEDYIGTSSYMKTCVDKIMKITGNSFEK